MSAQLAARFDFNPEESFGKFCPNLKSTENRRNSSSTDGDLEAAIFAN
jgi:hypothetical protein